MPVPYSPERRSKRWYTRWWAIALYIAAGAIAIACAMGDDDDDDDDEDDDGLSEQFDDEDFFDDDSHGEDGDAGTLATVTIVADGSWKITTLQG